ncbi:MAG: transposase [Chromatiaceae bacterium]|nr:transposase [Chromatiaceae bacterium]
MDAEPIEPAAVTEVVPSKPRRRRFSLEFKRQIVEEALAGRDSISVIARRHDINANQLFKWKRQYQSNGANPVGQPNLLPVQVKASLEQDSVAGQFSEGRIEIVFRTGNRITVQGEVPSTTLRMVLEVLS